MQGTLFEDLFDNGNDVRLDLAYPEFYREHQGVNTQLPSPLDTTTLFSNIARQWLDEKARASSRQDMNAGQNVQQLFHALQGMYRLRHTLTCSRTSLFTVRILQDFKRRVRRHKRRLHLTMSRIPLRMVSVPRLADPLSCFSAAVQTLCPLPCRTRSSMTSTTITSPSATPCVQGWLRCALPIWKLRHRSPAMAPPLQTWPSTLPHRVRTGHSSPLHLILADSPPCHRLIRDFIPRTSMKCTRPTRHQLPRIFTELRRVLPPL